MLLFAFLILKRDTLSRLRVLFRGRFGLTTPVPKKVLHLLDYMIPIELSCYGKKCIVGLITCLPESLQIMSLQLIDSLGSTQYRATKSSSFIEVGAHKFKDSTHRFVITAANLLQHNVTHLLHFFLGEGRCEQEFINKLQGCIKFCVDNLRKHLRCLQAGIRSFTSAQ